MSEEPTRDETVLFAVRTTANREEQVIDFISSNVTKKKIPVYSIVHTHGMRGYVYLEAENMAEAQRAAYGVPYARGILASPIPWSQVEHHFEKGKTKEMNIQKGDIAEILAGPFKREKVKITRIDQQKQEVVVELLEAAVPIPMTVKMDAVKVIRRDELEEEKDEE